LEGTETFYRIRVGNYRVIYAVDQKERIIVIHYVRHRKDAYRRL
jgi:mRNA interferase RelE/StbE